MTNRQFTLLLVLALLNVVAVFLNLYIGGWNLYVVPLSILAVCVCGYVLGRHS